MRPWILFIAVATGTAFAASLVYRHFQAQAAQAERDEALRNYDELRAEHERHMAEYKAQEEARLKRLADQDQAVIGSWKATIDAAQKLYDRDAAIYGRAEATRRHQAGVYLRAASGE